MTQAIPNGAAYSILCDLCPPNVEPVITNWREGKAKGQLYAMELTNLSGYRDEILMPPPREAGPRLEMTLQSWKGWYLEALGRQDRFFIDWASIARYAGFYYDKAAGEGQSAIKPVVAKWVEGISDPQRRIEAILRHVRDDFRYVQWISVIGRVHSVEYILKNKIADNEDKAMLLRAALESIGVDSYAALVVGKDYGSLNPNFFSFSQFTHTVVAIPQPDGSYQWLDPTVAYAPFRLVPWKDSGAEALLIQDGRGEIVRLPSKREANRTRYAVTVKPRRDGRAALEIKAEFHGEDAVDMREHLAPVAEDGRISYLQDWIKSMRPGAVLRSHAIEDLADVEKPLRIKMEAEAPGLVTVADDVMLVRGCVLSGLEVNPISRGERQYPLYVDRGWNREEVVIIEPPEGMSVAQRPSPVMARTPVTSLTFSCTSQGEDAVRCRRSFVARRNRWPASLATKVHAQFDRILQADRSTVAFRRSGG
ncbi:MAG: hypothetical protein ACE5JH_09415 [Acidobacteriota bacterium]